MSVIWKYLDKRSAAVDALKDYDSMAFIIANTSNEIKNTRDDMGSIRSPQFDGMPRTHNPQAGEERILKNIEEIDILQERYRQAVEYMEWFKPAWEELSSEERYVLETFYRVRAVRQVQFMKYAVSLMLSVLLHITGKIGHWQNWLFYCMASKR